MASTTSENFDKAEEYCKYCKKKVASAVNCEYCDSSFHPSCAIQSKAQVKGGKVNCCVSREKSEVNKTKSAENSDNMDERKIKSIFKELLNSAFNPFKKKMEEDMENLTRSVQYMSDAFEQQKKATEDLVKEVKALRKENASLKLRLDSLENKLNFQEQKEKQKNLVMVGIAKQKEQDTRKIVQKVLTTMKIDCSTVQDCFRLKQKEDGPILVKFDTEDSKNKVMRRIRELKGIKNTECGLEGDKKNIFLNDDLTHKNQQIFKSTREFKKANNYHSAYCQHGKIFLKKSATDTPTRIRSEQDLTL